MGLFDSVAQTGSLQGTLPPEDVPDPNYVDQNLAALGQFVQQAQASQEEQQRTPFSFSLDGKTGAMTVKGHGEDVLKALRGAGNYQKLVQGYSDQLAARQAQVQRQPLASLLAQLAGNIAASDPKLPGWVRGAGLTAQQLNPSVQQLQQQQIGLAQTLAQLQHQQLSSQLQVQAGLRDERRVTDDELRTQSTLGKEARLAAQAPIDELNKVQGEHLSAAVKGEIDPASATKLLVQRGLLKPQDAPAYQEQLQGVTDRFAGIRDQKTKDQAARDLRLETTKAEAQGRLFTQQGALLQTRLDAQAKANQDRLDAAEAKQTKKDQTPPAIVSQKMADLTAADKALDQIEALLKDQKNDKYFGPFAGPGYSVAQRLGKAPKEFTFAKEQVALQTANAIKSTGAGARGFGPNERGYFIGLSESVNRTPADNLAIVEAWRKYLDNERQGYQINFPKVIFSPQQLGVRLGAAVDGDLGLSDFEKWKAGRK